jgi:hypothetical protein
MRGGLCHAASASGVNTKHLPLNAKPGILMANFFFDEANLTYFLEKLS